MVKFEKEAKQHGYDHKMYRNAWMNQINVLLEKSKDLRQDAYTKDVEKKVKEELNQDIEKLCKRGIRILLFESSLISNELKNEVISALVEEHGNMQNKIDRFVKTGYFESRHIVFVELLFSMGSRTLKKFRSQYKT